MRPHARQDGTDQMQRAEIVDRHGPLERIERLRFEPPRDDDPGAGHHQRRRSQRRDRRGHRLFDPGSIGDIDRPCRDRHAVRPQRTLGRGQPLGIAREQRQVPAALRQTMGQREADAARSTADDGMPDARSCAARRTRAIPGRFSGQQTSASRGMRRRAQRARSRPARSSRSPGRGRSGWSPRGRSRRRPNPR
jgi:hypothetical protein